MSLEQEVMAQMKEDNAKCLEKTDILHIPERTIPGKLYSCTGISYGKPRR